MEFGSIVGGDDGEHSNVGFVEISEIHAPQDAFFFETEPIDRVPEPPPPSSSSSPSSSCVFSALVQGIQG